MRHYAASSFFLVLLLAAINAPVFADITNRLALYYSFDVDQGAVVTDQSGNGRNATVHGAEYVGNGVSGGAYRFDGTNWIDGGDVLDLEGTTTQLTVCAWIKVPFVVVSDSQIIVAKLQEAVPYSGWGLAHNFVFGILTSELVGFFPELVAALGNTSLGDNRWHFVCGTYESSPNLMRCRAYVDGGLQGVDTRTNSHASTESATPLTIGLREPNGTETQGFRGIIDEVRIYDRILSNADLLELFDLNNPEPPSPSSLLIARIGFSNDPNGDMDVTEFLTGETLYIILSDVDMTSFESSTKLHAVLTQHQHRKTVRKIVLFTGRPDGSFIASQSLSLFKPGPVDISIDAKGTKGEKLSRMGHINIH